MLINLPDLVNALSCLLLMFCLVPVANIISWRKHPGYTALVVLVAGLLLISFLDVFDPTAPPVPWSVAWLHATWAVALLVCRRRAWLFVRVELGDVPQKHPVRRAADVTAAMRRSADVVRSASAS